MIVARGWTAARQLLRPAADQIHARVACTLLTTSSPLLLPPTLSALAFHASPASSAFQKFTMPAMSPTMTEGGLATWKVDEGKPFSAGDVLLEIETDKATMDVEAQDDGVMAKILVQAGEKNVAVGKIIAVLAEEGDELSKWESEVDLKDEGGASKKEEQPKKEEPKKQEASSSSSSSGSSSSSSNPAPSSSTPDRHSATPTTSTKSHTDHPNAPMFPSVLRVLRENNLSIDDATSKIKGTGLKGMLTKGDVLSYLGKASSPTGTYKAPRLGIAAQGGPPDKLGGKAEAGAVDKSEPLTATQLRAAILRGLASSSRSHISRSAASATSPALLTPARDSLQEVLADYVLVEEQPAAASLAARKIGGAGKRRDWLDGLI
ncbi:hypothetical protein BCV69DRAFT_287885 [Microstroma glucosiphilum]|uniref:Single hybrid motif-containing protein n=1 Tax=Pseudomicrostroma glucosiphilum TaxID=1684307 RepID=A0A316U5N2_9BASI|nr:hypothetical protein BCV69DRAFT_287885 [Pseudomicrostroma glucosiphilum]PWN19771.1 hypothetical protein BCV69DRAFT_287885 [Pseudomicrostroma glucosiphilum]